MDKKEFIDDIKSELKTSGWCQGSFENGLGQHCLIGAFNKCYDEIYDEYEGIDDVVDSLFSVQDLIDKAVARKTKKAPDRNNTIKWNDSKKRKFKDVLQVLDLAKKIAKIAER